MSRERESYAEALKDRRNGIVSQLGAQASFVEVKPDFYADSRILSEDALLSFKNLKQQYPPYGLVEKTGSTVESLKDSEYPWLRLAGSLRYTGRIAVETATPSLKSCPYHEVLDATLGRTQPALRPLDGNYHGLDTLRNVVAPGAELNSPLFVSLIRRLPALQRLHGNHSDRTDFARRSVSLLREPLAHPQQWAAAFVYSLGSLSELLTERFLNDGLALEYTKLERTADGHDRLAWAKPTEQFTTRREVRVADRTAGRETDLTGDHITVYPVGTRLKDITITEPTIGCPGDQLARTMWNRTIDAVVGEQLWQLDQA